MDPPLGVGESDPLLGTGKSGPAPECGRGWTRRIVRRQFHRFNRVAAEDVEVAVEVKEQTPACLSSY